MKSQSGVVQSRPREPLGEFTGTTVCPQTSSAEVAVLQAWVFETDIHHLVAPSARE